VTAVWLGAYLLGTAGSVCGVRGARGPVSLMFWSVVLAVNVLGVARTLEALT
jgi:hypothetical protein